MYSLNNCIYCDFCLYDNIGASILNSNHGPGAGPIQIGMVHCIGTEAKLINCSYVSYPKSSQCNSHNYDVSIECSGKAY